MLGKTANIRRLKYFKLLYKEVRIIIIKSKRRVTRINEQYAKTFIL